MSVALGIIPSNEGIAQSVNYPSRIDQNTRLIRYRTTSRTESLSDSTLNDVVGGKASNGENRGWHVVGQIDYGVDAVIIVQLPENDEDRQHIDRLLQRIRGGLENTCDITSSGADLESMESDRDITIYSNIPELCRPCRSLASLLSKIKQIRQNSSIHRPYNYELYPAGSSPNRNHNDERLVHSIEAYLLALKQEMAMVQADIN